MSTYLIGHVKGDKGDTGSAAGFGTPTASVDANTGTPSVTVTASGPDTAKAFDFQFHNLKGNTGATGPADTTALNIVRSTSTDEYKTTKAYSAGDYVIYNNTLYKCTSACSAGSWATNSSHFTATTVTSALGSLNQALNNISTDNAHLIQTVMPANGATKVVSTTGKVKTFMMFIWASDSMVALSYDKAINSTICVQNNLNTTSTINIAKTIGATNSPVQAIGDNSITLYGWASTAASLRCTIFYTV